jgi:ParB family chromosome partitioning protein
MARDAAESIRLVDPSDIERNPENPRLIFREDELLALQDSIASQGILVPLTIYQHGDRYVILDGERRWRCALKLGLSAVPAIVQPEPDAVTNIMMMFAIHKTRSDWDPLPTAIKLAKLEEALAARLGRSPTWRRRPRLAGVRCAAIEISWPFRTITSNASWPSLRSLGLSKS